MNATKQSKAKKKARAKKPKSLGLEVWEAFATPIARVFDSSHARYMLWGTAFGLVLVLCIVRIVLFVLSDRANKYRDLGKTINVATSTTVAPVRGSIYSSDDRPIAVTAPVYRLYFDFGHPKLALLREKNLSPQEKAKRDSLEKRVLDDLDSFAKVLQKSFAEEGATIDRATLRTRWRKGLKSASRYCPVVNMDVSYLLYNELIATEPLLAPPTDSLKTKRSPGILKSILTAPEERSKRMNPFGSLAKRTIGSLYGLKEGGLSRGRQGLEAGMDSMLRGVEGQGMKVHQAGTGRQEVFVRVPAQDGYSVYTTLDMNIQSQLERIMRNQLSHFKAESGTAILLDVPTGKVLAMTNLLRTARGYSEDQNFAITDMSEPGSTFKVASMLVALENNLVNPQDTIDVGNGTWEVGGRIVRDHNAHHGGYGRISVSQVIERSSNVGVAKIIQKHFRDKPSDYVRQVRELAFGHDLRVEIPGAEKARIRMPSKDRWYGTTLAWMSFGYETQIPPMYTAAFFNAIANGGKLMKPYLVREVRDKDGKTIEQYAPVVVKESIAKPSSIKAIQEMLRKVVSDGTGKLLRSRVVSISGKSGTAQIAKGGSYRGPDGTSHQVSFCGYFPSEAPRYTLMVVIREPSKEFAAGGGSMAGPVVKELAETIVSMEQPSHLDSLFREREPKRTSTMVRGRKSELIPLLQATGRAYKADVRLSEASYVYVDSLGRERAIPATPKRTVPHLVGLTAEDASYYLSSLGYRVRLIGYGRVVEQSPVAGTSAERGTTVTLKLSSR